MTAPTTSMTDDILADDELSPGAPLHRFCALASAHRGEVERTGDPVLILRQKPWARLGAHLLGPDGAPAIRAQRRLDGTTVFPDLGFRTLREALRPDAADLPDVLDYVRQLAALVERVGDERLHPLVSPTTALVDAEGRVWLLVANVTKGHDAAPADVTRYADPEYLAALERGARPSDGDAASRLRCARHGLRLVLWEAVMWNPADPEARAFDPDAAEFLPEREDLVPVVSAYLEHMDAEQPVEAFDFSAFGIALEAPTIERTRTPEAPDDTPSDDAATIGTAEAPKRKRRRRGRRGGRRRRSREGDEPPRAERTSEPAEHPDTEPASTPAPVPVLESEPEKPPAPEPDRSPAPEPEPASAEPFATPAPPPTEPAAHEPRPDDPFAVPAPPDERRTGGPSVRAAEAVEAPAASNRVGVWVLVAAVVVLTAAAALLL